jgi:hypothetical protein
MKRLSRRFTVFVLIVLFALLFDIISTYYALLSPRVFEHDPQARWFIQYLGKEMGLLVYFLTKSAAYSLILFPLDLFKFQLTEVTFSVSLGFGHFLAGISNTSIYLGILWIYFSLIECLLLIEKLISFPAVLVFLIEIYYKKVSVKKDRTDRPN